MNTTTDLSEAIERMGRFAWADEIPLSDQQKRLIAAAPDLLETLAWIEVHAKTSPPAAIARAARKAIARATAE